ncbi:DegT/DnrJ/EryC1/StrS family aminotransferase [Brachybacterium hainanense]|uniref:DegT/DnrJ/EryC1/StrS family aminotransferase n=1 Tax=Brachybacterium hainanense TaxID=1541174 RepID=A0ABV6R734_9MICO
MRIPLSVPLVGPCEEEALARVLADGWIAPAGPDLDRFEDELAARTGRARAVAVASGTAALHLQLLAAGIGPGDRVLCPTLTFVATANAISYTGAVPVLVDCDRSGNLDAELAEEVCAQARRDGRPIRALLPVDLYGKVADHARLAGIARRYGALLLVDAAESLGARRDGAPAGSHGLAAALSFNGNKIVTASAGGAVLTDDEELADRVLHLATQAREPVPHYLHREIGFAYRLSNVLAALGRAQLGRLDEFLAARRAHRDRYRALCLQEPGLGILGGDGDADAEDSCWLTVLRLDDAAPGPDAVLALGRELAARGVETRRLFTPLHRQPLFADRDRSPHRITGQAEDLFDRCLAVPSSPASSARDIEEVCEIIHEIRSRDRAMSRA